MPDAAVAAGDGTAPRAWPSFVLGLGFSLAFCPTLFVLFFGATLTMAARSAEGFAIPAVFALGTVVPLLGFVALALTGSRAADRLRRGIRRANRPLRWVAAGLLVLLGLHDTLVYWFL
jgi:cytochrome c biogenesis protein CcdA